MATDRQRGILRSFEGKRVAIAGLGRTSVPLVRLLSSTGARVTVFDKKETAALAPQLEQLRGSVYEMRAGVEVFEGINSFDYVFPSPGINPDRPDFIAARSAGTKFGYEIELTMQLAECPVIGITGSSGKTTTTTLTGLILEEMCSRLGHGKVLVGGNIGQPLVEAVMRSKPGDFAVLEMSSFQLKFLSISPDISAVLNITPNHLDVHPSMEDYILSKANILAFQNADSTAVLGADDKTAKALAPKCRGRILWFSTAGSVEAGAFLDEGKLILRMPGCCDEPVMPASDIRIPGMHNVQNVLAAMAVSAAAGASAEDMRAAVSSFLGVEHRLEKAGEVGGVLYVNDSIATSPARTIAALKSFDMPIVLIAGGYDKHLPFDEMAEISLGRVRHLVTLGVTADKIEAAFKDAKARTGKELPSIERAASFEDAVAAASQAAQNGDVVLMSPACASYDMFNNFEERGRRFKELVSVITGKGR